MDDFPIRATNGHQVHVCIGGKRVSDDIHTFEAGVQIVFLGAGDVLNTSLMKSNLRPEQVFQVSVSAKFWF